MTLEERFKFFLSGLKNAEDIDLLALPADKKGNRIADYFLFNREVILEIKTLVVDAEHKVEETVELHRDRQDFPVFYGEIALDKVLAYLPDGEAINEQIYGRITRSIQKAFKSANDQILSTRDSFGSSNSVGILALLNENIGILSPDIIAAKISEMLTRKHENGSFCYSQIASVLIINEGHFVKLENGMNGLPLLVIDGPYAEKFPNIRFIMDFLIKSWADFNRTPLFMKETGGLQGMNFQLNSDIDQKQETMIPRQELWRREYLSNPYLRENTKEVLLHYGRDLMNTIAPMMMVGSEKPSADKIQNSMQQFTHFMEEMKFRGLDMRELGGSDKR